MELDGFLQAYQQMLHSPLCMKTSMKTNVSFTEK